MRFFPGAGPARHAVLAVSMALGLGGCIGPFSPSGTEKALEDAREQWDRQGISSYRFRVSRLCFCAPDARRPLIVTVQLGRVTSLTDAETGAPFTGDPFMPVTVDGLFAAVDAALDRDADHVDVRYDPQLGYPLEIAIDESERLADEEVTYYASDLQPL